MTNVSFPNLRIARFGLFLAATLMLGACTTDGTTPGTATVAAANPADAKVQPPLDEHQASASCWMKYDSSKMSLEQKSAAVDKCIDETMRAQKR